MKIKLSTLLLLTFALTFINLPISLNTHSILSINTSNTAHADDDDDDDDDDDGGEESSSTEASVGTATGEPEGMSPANCSNEPGFSEQANGIGNTNTEGGGDPTNWQPTYVPPTPTPSCPSYNPNCNVTACQNGATNFPTCNNVCTNGYSNYPTCGPTACTNGATNFPTCNNNFCTNGASNFPACNSCPSGYYLKNSYCIPNPCGATIPPTNYGSICDSGKNACGQSNSGTITCQSSCSATSVNNDSCISNFRVTTSSVNPNGSVEFSWNVVEDPNNRGVLCSFYDRSKLNPNDPLRGTPIPGLSDLPVTTDRVRINNIQRSTEFCLYCRYPGITREAQSHQWVRVIRIGEN